MNTVFVDAVGLAAPGLASWQQAAAVLRGEVPYVFEPLAPHVPAVLPANERRRATATIRLAFQAAEDAMRGTALAASDLATVFASSDADLHIIHRICVALTQTPRFISPTDFHNSVHNAAAGYWSIAVGARGPSSTLSSHDASFAAGLLEASLLTSIDRCDTLLVAFDLPAPQPLLAKRPMMHPAATALILTREPTARSLCSLRCSPTHDRETPLGVAALEELRSGNPAARSLPLLERLASGVLGRVVLPHVRGSNLAIEIAPP